MVLEKDGGDQLDRSCEKRKVLQKVELERDILQKMKCREVK